MTEEMLKLVSELNKQIVEIYTKAQILYQKNPKDDSESMNLLKDFMNYYENAEILNDLITNPDRTWH